MSHIMFVEPSSESWLPTRQSLLSRLRDCDDHAGWREFFETYWRLIFNVARRSGLTETQAQDVVQNTFIYLARRMPKFRYDSARGSFKGWLRAVTRSRINVYLRAPNSDALPLGGALRDSAPLEEIADPAADLLDDVWQREWEENLLNAAFRRVRRKVSSQQLLIFRLATINELSLTQVARDLGISLPPVYLARHRVGRLLKAEIARLRTEIE